MSGSHRGGSVNPAGMSQGSNSGDGGKRKEPRGIYEDSAL